MQHAVKMGGNLQFSLIFIEHYKDYRRRFLSWPSIELRGLESAVVSIHLIRSSSEVFAAHKIFSVEKGGFYALRIVFYVPFTRLGVDECLWNFLSSFSNLMKVFVEIFSQFFWCFLF